MCPILPRSIEHDKRQETIYSGPKGLLTIIVQGLSLFLRTYENVENTIF